VVAHRSGSRREPMQADALADLLTFAVPWLKARITLPQN
jgi:hypothetical protein